MRTLKLRQLVVVEGKYDKIRLQSVIDAAIVTTEGFGVYRDREKKDYIRRLARGNGVVILTDSDKAGFQIRNFIKKLIPDAEVTHVYIPDILGKEPRKPRKSAEGKLGVEGIDRETLAAAFRRAGLFIEGAGGKKGSVTKADFYEWGFSGKKDSAGRRRELAKKIGLPEHIGSNALLEALNLLYTAEESRGLFREVFDQTN